MTTHLLDTSIYSERLKPRPSPGVVQHWSRMGDQALATSAICEAELLFGLERRNSERLWLEYRNYLENRIRLFPIDKPVADVFGKLKSELERKGRPRADFDLLVAATALSNDLILVTANDRHFRDIPALKVENWTKSP